jgi:NAD(P) transhydrogenase subunit alpha
MIQQMRNGGIIVDLAAATGGNTPLTKNNETVAFLLSIQFRNFCNNF